MSEEQKLKCKIVLLSCWAAGKTCIINRYVYDKFDFVKTTTGPYLTTKTMFIEDENKSITFEIWDTNGGELSRLFNRVVFKDADVIFLVYDITTKKVFEDLKYYAKHIKENDKPDASK